MPGKRIPQVGIVMSSEKDLTQMEEAATCLQGLNIPFELAALSPYRLPDEVRDWSRSAEKRGLEVILAGSGGTNELACMVASYTTLPVIGVPLCEKGQPESFSKELAAVLSSLETPPGIPVATVGYNDTQNAAMLAAAILGVKDHRVRRLLEKYRRDMQTKSIERAERVAARGVELQEEG